MLNLLNIEFKKIIPYPTFWIISALYIVFIPSALYSVGQFKIEGFPIDFESAYSFPNIWNNITYIASWFNLFLIGLLVIILVSNEFKFKTFRQHTIDGSSRLDFFKGKMLLILTFALGSTLYLFVLGILFGFAFTDTIQQGDALENINYLLIYFIQIIGYMVVALLIGVIIRSSALSIILFIFSIFLEGIARTILRVTTGTPLISDFFPMHIISNLTPFPTPSGMLVDQLKEAVTRDSMPLDTSVIVAVIYIVIFSSFSYWFLEKKDIR